MKLIEDIRRLAERYLPQGSLRARFASGTLWVTVGFALAQALTLLASIINARFLGKAGFGELGMVLNTIGAFGVLAGMSLSSAATRYVAELKVKDPDRAGRIIALCTSTAMVSGGGVALLVLLFAPHLARHVMNAAWLAPHVRVASLLLFINALNGAQNGALSGFEAFRTAAKANLLKGLLGFPFMITGVYWWGLTGALWGNVVASAAGWLVFHIALREESKKAGIVVRYHNLRGELPMLWRFSVPAVLSGFFITPITWLANVMLVHQRDGYSEMGLFNAANQWRTFLSFVPGIISATALPMLSETLNNNRQRSMRKIFLTGVGVSAVFVLSQALVLSTISPWIMSRYGPSFRNGWLVLIFCLVGGAILGIQTSGTTLIIAAGKMWASFFLNLAWAAVFLAMVALLVGRGALGLSIAYAASYVVHCVSTFVVAYYAVIQRKPKVSATQSPPPEDLCR